MGLVMRTAAFAGEMPLDKHAAALPHRPFFEHWIALVRVYPPVPQTVGLGGGLGWQWRTRAAVAVIMKGMSE